MPGRDRPMDNKSNQSEKDTTPAERCETSEQTTAVAWTAPTLQSETETPIKTTGYRNNKYGSRVELSLTVPYGTTTVNLDAADAKEFARAVLNAAAVAEHRQAPFDNDD